jgi:hypothetical protein
MQLFTLLHFAEYEGGKEKSCLRYERPAQGAGCMLGDFGSAGGTRQNGAQRKSFTACSVVDRYAPSPFFPLPSRERGGGEGRLFTVGLGHQPGSSHGTAAGASEKTAPGSVLLLLVHILGIQFLCTIAAQAVGEFCIGVLTDIGLKVLPRAFVITDLLA